MRAVSSPSPAEAALLTAGHGYRLPLEHVETLWRGGRFAVAALAGTGLALGADDSGHYTTWSAALGVFPLRLAAWKALGVRLVYRPALLTSIRFSPAERDHYRDRYPDDRTTLGPEHRERVAAGQRLEVAATALRPFAEDWMLLWMRAGLLPSLMAGSRLARSSSGRRLGLPRWASVGASKRRRTFGSRPRRVLCRRRGGEHHRSDSRSPALRRRARRGFVPIATRRWPCSSAWTARSRSSRRERTRCVALIPASISISSTFTGGPKRPVSVSRSMKSPRRNTRSNRKSSPSNESILADGRIANWPTLESKSLF